MLSTTFIESVDEFSDALSTLQFAICLTHLEPNVKRNL